MDAASGRASSPSLGDCKSILEATNLLENSESVMTFLNTAFARALADRENSRTETLSRCIDSAVARVASVR